MEVVTKQANDSARCRLLNTPLHGVNLVTTKNTLCTQDKQHSAFNLHLNIQYNDYVKSSTMPVWTLTDQGERYTTLVELYQDNNTYQINVECEGVGSFTYSDQGMQVHWQTEGTGFEHYLQSIGLATWLELKDIPCIHANAISYQGEAYLLIAPSRTGKSTISTQLCEHGFVLMTDDMAAIHPAANNSYNIYPSWPKVRLWPDSAKSLKNNSKQLTSSSKKVHERFAKHEIDLQQNTHFCATNQPKKLKAIYLLDRQTDCQDISNIKPLSASQSLVHLLQNSMLANAYTHLGTEQTRLTTLANMLAVTPMYKLQYKSDLTLLDKVCTGLKEHINVMH